jgi:hypothetical protein
MFNFAPRPLENATRRLYADQGGLVKPKLSRCSNGKPCCGRRNSSLVGDRNAGEPETTPNEHRLSGQLGLFSG